MLSLQTVGILNDLCYIVSADDANNHSPQFSQTSYYYTISVYTGASVSIGQVVASDLDSGTFGQFTYTLDTVSSNFIVSSSHSKNMVKLYSLIQHLYRCKNQGGNSTFLGEIIKEIKNNKYK